MKRLLPLFALLCLVGNAAPKPKANPQIAANCTTLGDGNCDSSQSFSLELTGLDPHKLYIVDVNNGFSEVGGILNPATDTLSLDNLALAPGDYTFTIYQVNHNGTPHAAFGQVTVTFE